MRPPSTPSESGATAIIVAGSLLLIFGVAALAVDLSALRLDIRADRLAADAAATAGAAAIDPFAGSEADAACLVALDYLLLNLDDEGTLSGAANCSNLAGSCDPLVARVATASAGPYDFTITHPVPDGHPLLGSQPPNATIDGNPCQRLGVTVQRARPYEFAQVMGFDSGSTTVSSVARIAPGVGSGEVVPLLVLEPTSCNALYTSGQGGVTVSYFEDSPGLIVVDSDASGGSGSNSCTTGTRYSIDAQGTTNGWIRAIPTPEGIPSAILSYALSGDPGANPTRSYDPYDLTTPATGVDPSDPPESWFRLYPQPQAVSRRITRAPIDWRYNCKQTYPEYPLTLTSTGGVPVPPCPTAPAPHIDDLVDKMTEPGMPTGFFQRWTDHYPCAPASAITATGNWWIDCPGGFIVNGVSVTFDGDLVFDGDVDVRSSGSLSVNQGDDDDQVVYVRGDGDLLKRAQSSITLHRTFVYLEEGAIDLVGGDGGLTWTAPLGGNFEDLALWAEATRTFQIGGQAGNTLTGTFFTPMGEPFTLTGQGGQFQTDAQFLTRRLEVAGQGEVRMQPDPTRQTLIPIREVRLIR